MPSASDSHGPPAREVVRIRHLLASGRFGLVSDIDGTLSHIAPSPEQASVDPEVRRLLAALSQRLPLVAVISGRSAAKAREMVGVDGIVYLGNYGLERWVDGRVQPLPVAEEYIPRIHSTFIEARRFLDLPCLIFEDKGVSASVHFRLCPDPLAARQTVLEVLTGLAAQAGLVVEEGRSVIEVRAPVDVDKGTALKALVAEYRLDSVAFIGDDVSDLAAFQAIRRVSHEASVQGIAVGVSSPEMPPAVPEHSDFVLPGVDGVTDFLRWVVKELGAH
ncbi:MAG: trehalose-phosphatase [Chloroflexi bacterium]|nr:trehalose-phosphatase [Chloroflexota bacterium]